MNGHDQLASALLFLVRFAGTFILAAVFGTLGAFIHVYLGVVIFLIIIAAGIVGSVKLYLGF